MLKRWARSLVHAVAFAAAAPVVPSLSVSQQEAIAGAFAPTFVFHRDEAFFPVSPLFPETADAIASSRLRSGSAVAEALGDPSHRVLAYSHSSLDDRLRAAAITYRVYAFTEGGRSRVAVEYWCHYVFNEYSVRLAWFPVRFPADHEQDLESVRVILEPRSPAWLDDTATVASARQTFVVAEIVASAHAGSVPANRVLMKDMREVSLPIHLLVERGSHAMATDLDRDGRFTPEKDSSRGKAFVWGIRDQGALGLRYRDRFSDSRAGPDVVRLCGPADAAGRMADRCRPYRLERADEVDAWFRALNMTRAERLTVHGSAGWFAPVFVDRDHRDLLLPPARPAGDPLVPLLSRPRSSERGWLVGLTSSGGKATAVFGRQHAFLTPSRAPDWFLDTAIRARSGTRPVGTGSVAATYPLDAITRLVLSFGWLSDAHRPAGARLDTFAGGQFRVGHLRVRSGYRIGVRAFDTVVFGVF